MAEQEKRESSEFSAVSVTNPLDEDFSQNYNGEPYTLKAGETNNFAKSVSYHIAFHLSTKMLRDEFPWDKKKKRTPQEINSEATRFSQMTLYDNPKRRIALYKILGDVLEVQNALARYPISHRGYLEGGVMGTMEEYRKFVEDMGGTYEKSKEDKETIESLSKKLKEMEKKLEEKEKKEEPKKEKKPVPKKKGRPPKYPDDIKQD